MTILPIDDAPHERAAAKFTIDVSDESFSFQALAFHDPIVTAAQIAERFGAHPVSQFKVLQQLDSGEIESKRPNETTDLRGAARERFFVVRSDRTYGFTVDGRSLEWPLATIAGMHLRELARAGEHQELTQVSPGGFAPIGDTATVSFKEGQVEEFRLVPRASTVTVRYREQPFELERRDWVTEELMERFGVPAGYKLDLIEPDGEFKELKPGKTLRIRDGMEFTSHVPAGQSS